MQVNGQPQETVALSPAKGASTRTTHRTGKWLSPKANLNVLTKKNFLCRYWKKNHNFSVYQPVF
jgi:hypothetical protein